jgi:hypothetical protein
LGVITEERRWKNELVFFFFFLFLQCEIGHGRELRLAITSSHFCVFFRFCFAIFPLFLGKLCGMGLQLAITNLDYIQCGKLSIQIGFAWRIASLCWK